MSAGPPALAGPGLFLAVAATHALAVMSPGPDFAMVVRQTLARGRRAGVVTALGIACGIGVHLTYALFGLAWAIEKLPALHVVLKLAGGALLIWIGIGALRSPAPGTSGPATAASPRPRSGRALPDFWVGLLTNVLNVKAMLFFVALCSTVIGENVSPALKLALGAWMIAATGAWFCFVAVTLGHPRVREQLGRAAHWIDRAMGALLILLGTGILVSVVT